MVRGTAKDARAPFFARHFAADLGDGLSYREAYTTSAADEVIDHLVNVRGPRRRARTSLWATSRDKVSCESGLDTDRQG